MLNALQRTDIYTIHPWIGKYVSMYPSSSHRLMMHNPLFCLSPFVFQYLQH